MQFAAILLVAIVASASAFAPMPTRVFGQKMTVVSAGDGELGAGGMADTRDPEPFVNDG